MEILEQWHRDVLDGISDKHADENKGKEFVCMVCGIPWKDGVGFVGKHIAPCANAVHGWNFVEEKS